MSGWFYARHGKTIGPFSWEQLRALVQKGELRPEEHVYEEGLGKWLPASAVNGLCKPATPAAVRAGPPPAQPAPAPSVASPAAVRSGPPPKPSARPAPDSPTPQATPQRTFSQRLFGLPKPVLFGLCGALGGFCAALLLGEALWAGLRPPSVNSGPRLELAIPEAMRIYAGGANRFTIKAARQGFDDPVRVELAGAPPGVHVEPVALGPKAHEAEIVVRADAALPPGKHQMKVKVGIPDRKDGPRAEGTLELNVEAPPANLRMAVSPQVAVLQGGTARFGIKLARSNVAGPVKLAFKDAPPRVSFSPQVVPAGRDGLDVEVSVPREAGEGNVVVTVEAAGGTASTREMFNLEVRAAPVPKVDILFVLDLTGSMQFAIDGVKDGIGSFVSEMIRQRIDARFGLIAFRDIEDDKEMPYALKFGRETFTTDPAAFRKLVEPLIANGGGDTPESSLQALTLAAKQPFRDGASRVLVLITDAPPKFHPNIPPASPKEAAAFLRKQRINQVHLVVRDEDLKDHYGPLKEFKGSSFDIANEQQKSAFHRLLPRLGEAISRVTIASQPSAPSDASPPPLPAGSAPDLPPPAAPTLQAVQSTQAFAEEDRGRLVLLSAIWTAAVAAGISLLILAGQHFYLRQAWLRPGAAAQAIGGGLLAGLVGGTAGQGFLLATSGGATWEILSRILGWGLLGGVLGFGLTLFVPNLRWSRGLLGGLAGGLLGALTFMIISLAVGDIVGRLLGASVLGFCIGLMVALAELAFRRWWLEVAFNQREVRTVTLGTAAVSVGGDERVASVFVQGAPPIALRYRVDGDRVLVEDVAAGRTDTVEPGSRRRLGSVTVTVCSPDSARQSGYRLLLSGGAELVLGEGMPLTAADLPGLEAQADDGVVALVSRRPSDPRVLLLRNRSRRAWQVRKGTGTPQSINPGLGVELGADLHIDFGTLQGRVLSANGAS